MMGKGTTVELVLPTITDHKLALIQPTQKLSTEKGSV